MSVSEEQYQLILKYIDQSLSDEERGLFENNQQNSELFRKELEQAEVLAAGIKAVEKAEDIAMIREVFQEFDAESENKAVVKPMSKRFIGLGIAASVSLIACLIYLALFNFNSNDFTNIYQSYYEVFPADVATRSGKSIEQAMTLYDAGKYEEAIPLLKVLKEKSNNMLIPIYLANAYLESDQTKNAIDILLNYEQSDKDAYSFQFYRWYLGLAYLKANKKAESIEVFTEIANRNGIYQQQSKAILVKLK